MYQTVYRFTVNRVEWGLTLFSELLQFKCNVTGSTHSTPRKFGSVLGSILEIHFLHQTTQLTSDIIVKKLPQFYENRRCITVCIKPHLYTNQLNPDNKLVHNFFKISFIVSLKSTHRPHWSLQPVVPYVCLSHACYTSRLPHLPWFEPNDLYLLKNLSMKTFIQLS